jgi:hypothetical protein
MQAQVKYESEIKTALLGDRTITVKNLTPVFSPQEQDKRNREIERRLARSASATSSVTSIN